MVRLSECRRWCRAVFLFGAALSTLPAMAAGAPPDKTSLRSSPIYYFDLTDLNKLDLHQRAAARRAWDTLHLVAAVQGIVNRHAPQLFLRVMTETDDFWFAELRKEGHWLAGRPVVQIHSLEQLLLTFRKSFQGLVLYTEKPWAASNLASTIAGVEDRLCVRYDPSDGSVYRQVLAMNLGLSNVLRLFREDGSPMFTGKGQIPGTDKRSTGSAKADAYLWAQMRYADSDKTSRQYLAYYIDSYWLTDPAQSRELSNATLTNHDFFIAKRAFFFDLGMWDDELPVDDPTQPQGTDVKVLKCLLRSLYDRNGGKIATIGGFVPWAWKYTNHGHAGGKHEGVPSEWEYARIISAYNGIMDADALGLSGMANASFYQHFPLRDRYPQNPRPTLDDARRAGYVRGDGTVAPLVYVLWYMGDYDSAAWLNQSMLKWWADPARQRITCVWAVNPNLEQRAPHVMDYIRRNQGKNDWFVAGDNGAGYLNPGMLTAPRLDPEVGDGWAAWVAHNLFYYHRYDLSITGFVIDGHAPPMGDRGLAEYQKFSPDGIVLCHSPRPGAHEGLFRGELPYVLHAGDTVRTPDKAGIAIARMIHGSGPQFLRIRTILKSPTWHEQTIAAAAEQPGGDRLRYVDPYTFFMLVKQHERSRHAQ